MLLLGAVLPLLASAAQAQPGPECGSVIAGTEDTRGVAAGIFCAAGDCGVRDLNADGVISAADLAAAVLVVGACEVPERRVVLDAGDDGPRGYLLVNRFGAATPDDDGEAVLPLSDSAPTLTYALAESDEVYAALSFGGASTLRIDALSTARALVALNPLLIPASPGEQEDIWNVIRASDAVDALGDSLAAAYAAGSDIAEDPDVAAKLEAAVLDVAAAFDEGAGAVASGAEALPPGECVAASTLRVCNYDMVNLTLGDSSGATLRVDLSSEGRLRLRTNVDWVTRVVELDAARLPSDGENYVFFPDAVDAYLKPGGLDRELVVRGDVAGGWFGFIVDPIGAIASRIVDLPSGPTPEGVALGGRGVFAAVALSGGFTNDAEERRSVYSSPWQARLARKALAINLVAALIDGVGFFAPIGGSELAELAGDLQPFLEATLNIVIDHPDQAAEAIAGFLVDGTGTILLTFAEVNAVPAARRRALSKLSRLSLSSVSRILGVWSSGIRVTTRIGGLLARTTPRESGYAVHSPADTFLESIQVPADGMVVETATVLAEGVVYRVVVSGLYRYDVGERGEFADAQYHENDNDRYDIRFNSVVFDGERLDARAEESDREGHSHVFYVTGRGAPLSLNISDSNYRDNEGFLDAAIFGP